MEEIKNKKIYQKWSSSPSPPGPFLEKHVHRLLKWVTDLQIINLQSSLSLHLHEALVEIEPPIFCLCRQNDCEGTQRKHSEKLQATHLSRSFGWLPVCTATA